METKKSIWQAATWTWRPGTSRESGDSIVRNLLLHWFPARVSKPSLSFSYSLWLGTVSATLFLALAATGGILMFLYVPSTESAYRSIKDLEFVVSYGWFVRAVHRMAAHLMVAVVALHMIRTFLTGAYKNGLAPDQNRPLNWIVGVVLLLFTLLLSFTGYLLPWDQLAYWAITVGTNIASAAPVIGEKIQLVLLGGTEIGQSTLIRFYVLHCFVLPVLLGGLFSWHMWRIRKDGGLAAVDRLALERKLEPADPGKKTYSLLGIAKGRTVQVQAAAVNEDAYTVTSSPNLIRRVLLVALATMAIVGILAGTVPAPLEEAANPMITPNPAKAPWYFLWLQELVADTTVHLGGFTINGALVGGILLPGLLVLLLAAWPYLDRSPVQAAGVWFAPERKRQNQIFLAALAAVLILTFVGTFMRGPSWQLYWPWESWPEIARRY